MTKRIISSGMAIFALCVSASGLAQSTDQRPEDSDPVSLGWMQGDPVPPEKIIRHADMGFYQFPKSRWSFSHMRELVSTKNVARGNGAVSPLPLAERADLDNVQFLPLGSDERMTWAQSLKVNYTDSIIVLHKGRIVYERYFGAAKPDLPHMSFSVTKSYFGTLAAILISEGKLDPDALVTKYIPEMRGSAFADATVRQVLDMTTGISYSEKYADPNSDVWEFSFAGGILPPPPGYDGKKTFYDYLPTLQKEGEHGAQFIYKSVNSEVLGWLIQRVTGQTAVAALETRIWRKLGAEMDAHMLIDSAGIGFAAGGFNSVLRDQARFGEMMRRDGFFNGQQIVPKSVVEDIRAGASKPDFAKAGYATLPGWSYRNQWWVSHNAHGAFTARGIHGQTIYIDPAAEMVIVRFASHPVATNGSLDATSLPAYQAIAEHLMDK